MTKPSTPHTLDLNSLRIKYTPAKSRLPKSAASKLLTYPVPQATTKTFNSTTTTTATNATSTTTGDMLFMPLLRRRIKNIDIRFLLAWILSIIVVIWFMNSTNSFESCYHHKKSKHGGNGNSNVEYLRLQDDVDDKLLNSFDTQISKHNVIPYNRNMPLIFVGGVPRSGTTLMRAMLDAHPDIRCGEETRIIPRLIYMRNQWINSKKEAERLKNAGMSDDIIDSAVGAFILEVITILI